MVYLVQNFITNKIKSMWSPVGADDIDDWIFNINQSAKSAGEEGEQQMNSAGSSAQGSSASPDAAESEPAVNRPKRAETATIMSYILKNEAGSKEKGKFNSKKTPWKLDRINKR